MEIITNQPQKQLGVPGRRYSTMELRSLKHAANISARVNGLPMSHPELYAQAKAAEEAENARWRGARA